MLLRNGGFWKGLHKTVRALIEACLHECITTASELKDKLIKVFCFFQQDINCNNFKNAAFRYEQ
jgi:hypothetical protein